MQVHYSITQMCDVAHTLGIDLYKSVMSHKLKDKTLPNEFYRNRFQGDNKQSFEELISMGYADQDMWQDLHFYYITKEGIKQFRKQFYDMVNYKPAKQRDLNYLKHRINFYCDFYHYKFGEDNSNHIISTYLNYWIKKYKVSHTTEDTIKTFHTELKRYYKKGLLN